MNTSTERDKASDNKRESYPEPDDSSDTPLDFHFIQDLPPAEAHRRAQSARRAWGKAEKTLVSWIVEIHDRKLYRHFACSSIYHYASKYLKLAGHTVAEFLRAGRKLAELSLLSSAYERGELSSTHVREITRVATPETERFWCETAMKCTTRKLEKLVAFTPRGGLPPVERQQKEEIRRCDGQTCGVRSDDDPSSEAESSIDRPGGRALSEHTAGKHLVGEYSSTTHVGGELHCGPAPVLPPVSIAHDLNRQAKYHDKLVIELTAEEMAIMQDAFQKARKESGKRDRKSLLLHMARAFLQGVPAGGTGKTGKKPPYQVIIHHHLPSGISWCDTEKGERPVPRGTMEKALCDAELKDAEENPRDEMISPETGDDPVRALHDSPAPLRESGGTGEAGAESGAGREIAVEYVNELYQRMKSSGKRTSPEGTRSPRRRGSTIPAATRKRVFERDGHSCQAPGCGSELFTVIHHLDPVALGGTHEENRLVTLCGPCHDLVHMGRLMVEGEAPHGLRWR